MLVCVIGEVPQLLLLSPSVVVPSLNLHASFRFSWAVAGCIKSTDFSFSFLDEETDGDCQLVAWQIDNMRK